MVMLFRAGWEGGSSRDSDRERQATIPDLPPFLDRRHREAAVAHLPPSVNHVWRHTKGGKTYRTAGLHGVAERRGLEPQGAAGRPAQIHRPRLCHRSLRRPRTNADLDNRLGALPICCNSWA